MLGNYNTELVNLIADITFPRYKTNWQLPSTENFLLPAYQTVSCPFLPNTFLSLPFSSPSSHAGQKTHLDKEKILPSPRFAFAFKAMLGQG